MNAVLLAGESAIVTGAGSGIGRAIAKALAQEGAGLLVTDIAAEAGKIRCQRDTGTSVGRRTLSWRI